MMRKLTIVLILLLLLIPTSVVLGMDSDEMIDLATFTSDSGMTIESWQVTIKESLDKDKIEEITDKFKNSSLVTMTEDESIIKYHLEDDRKDSGLDVSYSVVIPKDKTLKAEMIAVIAGSNWSNEVEQEYLLIKRGIMDEFFTKMSNIYTWLTTGNSGIMDANEFEEVTKNYFDLQHISTQIDSNKNSKHKKLIYGYTEMWKQKFTIDGTPMNLQIAVVMDDEMNLKYTVGTPILIHEY